MRLSHHRTPGYVSFQVYDTLLDRTSFDNNFISIGDNPPFEVSDIEFLDNNAIEVSSGEEVFTFENWVVDFYGKTNDPLVKELLAYNDITTDQLHQLRQKLDRIDCNGYDKNDSLITIRYVGHWGESYNYIIPLDIKFDNNNWNKLATNYYWEHCQNGLFCGWTDW